MGTSTLMSVEDAARCAMAPTEDDISGYWDRQPEQALRNGHQAAAHKSAGQHGFAAHQIETITHWVRDTFGPTRGGSAAA